MCHKSTTPILYLSIKPPRDPLTLACWLAPALIGQLRYYVWLPTTPALPQPQVQVYSVHQSLPVATLSSEHLSSVCSINAFHPQLPALVGANSSGRLHVWEQMWALLPTATVQGNIHEAFIKHTQLCSCVTGHVSVCVVLYANADLNDIFDCTNFMILNIDRYVL